jgi:conjugal transfer pilus assembly protein TraV
MKRLMIALAISVAATTSGCSSFNPVGSDEFACPGMPSGVSCKTPREVYKLSDHEKSKGGSGASDIPTYVYSGAQQGAALNPMPILEQAKVMRIWVAPWVDRNNDQHWPGLVFTVIQPKQWHFNQEEFEGVEPPVPHRMLVEAAPTQVESVKTNSSVELPKNEGEVLN